MTKNKFQTRWAPLILGLLLTGVYVYIFQLENIKPTFSPLLLTAIVLLSFALYFFWTLPKLDTWGDRVISFVKMMLVGVPIYFISIKGRDFYINHQIKEFGVKTSGKITDTYSDTQGIGRYSYYVKYNFFENGSIRMGESQIARNNDYEIGDSVAIIYSSKNSNLSLVVGKY